MATETSVDQARSLRDAQLREKLQQLRQTDNFTNLYYLVRTYVYLAAVVGGPIVFHHYRSAAGWSAWWDAPVALIAIVLIGAGQHQLTGLAHEASHHILFKNRYLNDLISDWFCMFPLFSSTQHYRLQHLAHHQFVNDPVRDPDISQLKTSGHWFDFPLGKREFLRQLVKQLWIPNLVRFMRIRAAYNAIPSGHNPYLRKGWKPSKVPVRVGLAYIVGLIVLLTALVSYGDAVLLLAVPAVCWAGVVAFYLAIPARLYHQSRVHPVISARWMTVGRMTYITALFTALAWVTLRTGEWAAVYFFVLWVVPIFTSFSFFMILRQLVQHGNAGRGWLTNTRIFFVHRLIRFSVFPIGQDFHLPHHLFATVPHYRLDALHQLLLSYPEYREQAVVVEGYFLPAHHPPIHPTVLDVLGPDCAPAGPGEVHIDNSVLDDDDVDEKGEILREGELEVVRARVRSGENS
jgi:fatty acid desaturase